MKFSSFLLTIGRTACLAHDVLSICLLCLTESDLHYLAKTYREFRTNTASLWVKINTLCEWSSRRKQTGSCVEMCTCHPSQLRTLWEWKLWLTKSRVASPLVGRTRLANSLLARKLCRATLLSSIQDQCCLQSSRSFLHAGKLGYLSQVEGRKAHNTCHWHGTRLDSHGTQHRWITQSKQIKLDFSETTHFELLLNHKWCSNLQCLSKVMQIFL